MWRVWAGIATSLIALGACDDFSADKPATTANDAGPNSDASSPSDVDAGPRCDPTAEWDAPQLITELNTPRDDTRMRLTADLKVAYWQSDREKAGSNSVFTATRDDAQGKFGEAKRVFPNVTGQSDIAISGDNARLYLSQTSAGKADMFTSARDAGTGEFPPVVPMTDINTSANDENQGYVLPDGSAFYFDSDRPAKKYATTHIWVSHRADDRFGPASELAELETEFGEIGAVVTPDELTIFYSVRLGIGASSTDLWVATRANNVASFSNKKKVDSLSTNGRDAASYITPDQCEIFVSYDMTGNFELYHAYRKGTHMP